MQAPKIILSAAIVAVLGLLLVLLAKVKSSPAAHVPEDKLAQARAAHERLQARSSSAAARPLDIDPSTRPQVVAGPPDEPPAPPEPEARPPAPRPRPNILRTQAPRITTNSPVEFEGRMDEVNGFYDRGDYESAHEAAVKLLEEQPRNVRMLRVAVSTSCIMGEHDEARKYYDRLPERDQQQMAVRCKRYGVEF